MCRDYKYGFALLEDAKQIERIEMKTFIDPWSEKAIKEFMSCNGNNRFLVCKRGDRVIAYGGFYIVCDEVHIANIAVDERYRGLGIGRSLLKEIIAEGNALGGVRFTLEVRKSNEIARTLYEKAGFVSLGERKNYYENGESAIMMSLHTKADFEEKNCIHEKG